MWPSIKKEIPEATLNCYYGWKLFQSFYANNPERMKWKANMEKLMQQDGITEHGRVSKSELIKAQKECGIWAYPTHFEEINCCSGDTNILMPRDHKKYPYGVPIKDLVGKSNFYVYSYSHEDDKIVLGKVLWVKKTRKNAELLKITLDDGTILKFTPDHRFMLRDGTYKKANKLEVGQSLMPLYERPTFMIKQPSGYWQHEHRIVGDLLGKIEGKHIDHKDGNRYNNNIENLQILDASEHAKKTFKGREHSISGKKKLAKLSRERILKTFPNKELRTAWAKKQCKNMWDKVNAMSQEDRDNWLANRAKKRAESEKRNKFYNHKIVKIEKASIREDVYDMEVEKYHNFNAGGVFVHNCITALACQKNGCVPCVINYAALRETVGSGVRVEGDIYEPAVRRKYVEELVSLMKDEKKWKEEQEKGYQFAKKYEWPQIAQHWYEVFKET
jgi:hypothetical protein